VETAIANSLCFGLFRGAEQVGFARVVTDYATFGWLCDVFVDEQHRGRGLGKWLIETVVAHPDLASIKRLLLATSDAHELYRRYGGFEPLQNPERWMGRPG
jgi:GNAT superfamily N-acetyltransferase